MAPRFENRPHNPCACGCGGQTRATWVKGHAAKNPEWRATVQRPGVEAWMRRNRLANLRQISRWALDRSGRDLERLARVRVRESNEARRQQERVTARLMRLAHAAAMVEDRKRDRHRARLMRLAHAALVRAIRIEQASLSRERKAMAAEVRRWNRVRLRDLSRLTLVEAIASQEDDARRVKGSWRSMDAQLPGSLYPADWYDVIPAPAGDAEEALAFISAETLLLVPREHPAHELVQAVANGDRVPSTADRVLLQEAYQVAQNAVLAPRAKLPVTPGGDGMGGAHLKRGHGGRKHVATGRHEGKRQIAAARALRGVRQTRKVA